MAVIDLIGKPKDNTDVAIDANTKYDANGIAVIRDTPERKDERKMERTVAGLQKSLDRIDVSQDFNGMFGDDLKQYTKYGVIPNLVDKDLEWLKSKNQNVFAQFGNAIMQAVIGEGVGQTVGGFGGIPHGIATQLKRYFDKDAYIEQQEKGETYSNWLSNFGDKVSNWTREEFPIYEKNPDGGIHLGDTGYIASRIPSLASTLSLMIPALGYAKAASLAGRLAAKGVKAAVGAERVSAAAQTIAKWNSKLGKTGKFLDSTYRSQLLRDYVGHGFTALGMRVGENYREARETVDVLSNEYYNKYADMSAEEFEKYKLENVEQMGEDSIGLTKMEYANKIAAKGADRGFDTNMANFVFDFIQIRGLSNMWKNRASAATTGKLISANEAEAAAAGSNLTGSARAALSATTRAQKLKRSLGNAFGTNTKNGFGGILRAEWTEGIEEMVNEVGQREGQLYGRYLANDADAVNATNGQSYMDRLSDYLVSPQMWDAALWGALGGIAFAYAGNAVAGLYNGKNAKQQERARLAEIASRDMQWKNIKANFDTINAGNSPFELETDASGNPVLDANGNHIAKKLVTDDDKNAARDRVMDTAISELTLNAIESGNYELLKDYLADPKLKKALVDAGVTTDGDYENLNNQVSQIADDTYNQFVNWGSLFANSTVSDAYMNVAIHNNIRAERIDKQLNERITKNNTSNDNIASVGGTIQGLRNLGDIDTTMKTAFAHELEVELNKNLANAKANGASQREIDAHEKQLKALKNLQKKYGQTLGEELGLISDITNYNEKGLALPAEIQQQYDKWKATNGKDIDLTNPLAKYATNKGVNEFDAKVSSKYVQNISDSFYSEFEKELNNLGRINDVQELLAREAKTKKDVEEAAKETKQKAIRVIHDEFRNRGTRQSVYDYMTTNDNTLAPPIPGLNITRDTLKTVYGADYKTKIDDAYKAAKLTHPDRAPVVPPATGVPPVTGNQGNAGQSGGTSPTGGQAVSAAKFDALSSLVDELDKNMNLTADDITGIDGLRKRIARAHQLIKSNMSQERINNEYASIEQGYKDLFKNISNRQTGGQGSETGGNGVNDSTGLRQSRHRNSGETWEAVNNRQMGNVNAKLRQLFKIQSEEADNLDDIRKNQIASFIDSLKKVIGKISATPFGDAGDAAYDTATNLVNNVDNNMSNIEDHINQNKANKKRNTGSGTNDDVKRSEQKRKLSVLRDAMNRNDILDYIVDNADGLDEHFGLNDEINKAIYELINGRDAGDVDELMARIQDFLKRVDDALTTKPKPNTDSLLPPVEKVNVGSRGEQPIVNADKATDAAKDANAAANTSSVDTLDGMEDDDFLGATISVLKPFKRGDTTFKNIDVVDDGLGSVTIRAISSTGQATILHASQLQYLYERGDIDVVFSEEIGDEDEFNATIREVRKAVSDRNKLIRNVIYGYLDAVEAKPDSLGRKHLYFEDMIRFLYENSGVETVTNIYDNLFAMVHNIMEFENTIILADTDAVLKRNMEEMLDRIINPKPVTNQAAGNIKGDMIQVNMMLEPTYPKLTSAYDIKRYKTIMGLGKGDEVTIYKVGGDIVIESDGLVLGTLPKVVVDSTGRFVKTNENFKYVIDISPDGTSYNNEFINTLKDFVTNNVELMHLLEEYKIYKERNADNDANSVLVKILLNKDFNELRKFMQDDSDDTAIRSSVNHLVKILSHFDNSALDDEDSTQAILMSLDGWVNKLGNSYHDSAVLFNTIQDSRRKVKIGFASSGRIYKSTDNNGDPLYNNIREVIRAENSDDYELYAVDKDGNVLREPSGVNNDLTTTATKGSTLMFIKDSSGRRVRVHTRNNTITHKYHKGTKESMQLAKAVLDPVSAAANALLTRDYELIDEAMDAIYPYFSGPGVKGPTIFYGWAIVGHDGGYTINSRDGKSKINFNYKGNHVNRPNISIITNDGTSFLEPLKEDASNPVIRSMGIFNREMSKVADGVIFNTFLSNFRGNSASTELDRNGKMWIDENNHVVYSLPDDTLVNTGKTYKDFMIDNDMLVTDVGAVRDGDGNILGNFMETSAVGSDNGTTTVNSDKNIHIIPETVRAKTDEEKGEAKVEETYNPNLSPIERNSKLHDVVRRGTTLNEILNILGQTNDSFVDFIKLYEKLGVTVSKTIGRGNAFASYNTVTKEITIRGKFFTLPADQQTRVLLHELTHAYLHDGTNIEVLEGVKDIYAQFLQHLDDPNVSWSDSDRAWLDQFRYKGKTKAVAIEEFLVEALTNKSLIPYLNELTYIGDAVDAKGESLLSKLLGLVRELFMNSFNINKGSLLDAIDKTIGNIAKEAKTQEAAGEKIKNDENEVVENKPKLGRDKYKPNTNSKKLSSMIGEYNPNRFGSVSALRAAMPEATLDMFDEMVNENKLSFVCRL